MKFGGTSVAGLPQWQTIAALCRTRVAKGYSVALVCSALAGVTNRLQALCTEPAADRSAAIDGLIHRYRSFANELSVDAEADLARFEQELRHAAGRAGDSQKPQHRAELLALGEWASSRIGTVYLEQQGLRCCWQDSRSALTTLPEAQDRRAWLEARCAVAPDAGLQRKWAASGDIVVTQGFVAANAGGQTTVLGRGGSDTSAAYLGAALGADRVEIYTDVAGILSADPRIVADAELIPKLAYREALEIAGAGAAVVHPRCIRAAAEAGLPLSVRQADLKRSGGTDIKAGGESGRGTVKAVTVRRGMTAILLENQDIRRAVGFLATVFSHFAAEGVSIDQVATSETTTTVLIDLASNHLQDNELQRLADGLRDRCEVSVYSSLACVSLVGREIRKSLPRIGEALHGFLTHPLYLASFSASDLAYSLVVPEAEAGGLAVALHRSLWRHTERN